MLIWVLFCDMLLNSRIKTMLGLLSRLALFVCGFCLWINPQDHMKSPEMIINLSFSHSSFKLLQTTLRWGLLSQAQAGCHLWAFWFQIPPQPQYCFCVHSKSLFNFKKHVSYSVLQWVSVTGTHCLSLEIIRLHREVRSRFMSSTFGLTSGNVFVLL